MTPTANFAALLTRYFTQRLIQQRSASPHTIKSYRDTFHLLLLFAKTSLGKEPSQLRRCPRITASRGHPR
jgi:hypothetical protein